VKEQAKEEKEPETVNIIPATPVVAKTKKQVNYPSGIFTINHAKVIYAAEGTSLLSLANQYDISLSKLIEFNELAEMDVLDTDRLIFIERKQKKGTTDFHVATKVKHCMISANWKASAWKAWWNITICPKPLQLKTGEKFTSILLPLRQQLPNRLNNFPYFTGFI
jgi:hypothetical protein